jgi:hypothetical protein
MLMGLQCYLANMLYMRLKFDPRAFSVEKKRKSTAQKCEHLMSAAAAVVAACKESNLLGKIIDAQLEGKQKEQRREIMIL